MGIGAETWDEADLMQLNYLSRNESDYNSMNYYCYGNVN